MADIKETLNDITCEFVKAGGKRTWGDYYDYLIANGVTVQKQDGCEYCREDAEGYRKAFGAFLITNPFHAHEWKIRAHHCTPRNIYFCPMCGRKLAEPPKGE